MTEPAHFDSRPWTQADDDKLRKLAPTGLSSKAIGIRMNRTETAVARQLQVILRKIRPTASSAYLRPVSASAAKSPVAWTELMIASLQPQASHPLSADRAAPPEYSRTTG
jgi:hypothetical protein